MAAIWKETLFSGDGVEHSVKQVNFSETVPLGTRHLKMIKELVDVMFVQF